MTKLRIAALGSSFAAGPGIEPLENREASRSSRNYAHQLADRLVADLTDLSISGATLLNVLHERQYVGRQMFDPQLDHLPSNTDIVTLTCGGNDVGYIGGLVYDALLSYLGTPDNGLLSQSSAPIPDGRMLIDRLISVLDKIHSTAPNAHVYLVEYLSIIGNDTRPWLDVALTTNQMKHYVDVASVLSRAYNESAKDKPWATVVPVGEKSKGHALGSPVPWVDGFNCSMLMRGAPMFHPNLAGHTAIAAMLYDRIMGVAT